MTKTIIIGASGGIGEATARLLALEGKELVLVSRDSSKISTLADELGAEAKQCDSASFEEFSNLVQEVGEVGNIINCAGSLLLKPAHSTSEAEYQAVIDANLKTAFSVLHAAGKYMKSGGNVVLCSSAAARAGFANHEAIAAAKAGIIGLTLSAAATYGSSNIRINAVAPGLTETGLTAGICSNEMARKVSEGMHILGRIGTPEDVAKAIVFLTNQDWITGQVIGVDGGLGTVKPKAKA